MARVVLSSASPAVVAQRLTDLLESFPTAASSGVQWETLIRKYNEQHRTNLDISSLGHTSAKAAACALLFEVLRMVDSEDTDNPVVAIEDAVALTAKPGAIATWPSLYKTLCEIVQEHGSLQQHDDANNYEPAHTMLVSQLKPLLQRHWHAGFDETSLSYLTEEGTPVRLKKMKHLLHALLRFRDQRTASRGAAHSAVDKVLETRLELVQSKKHNDLLLRCIVSTPELAAPEAAAPEPCGPIAQQWVERRVDRWCDAEDDDDESTAASSAGSAELQQELAQLRSENARLRTQISEKQTSNVSLPEPAVKSAQVWALDDPFEPPETHYWASSPMSTAAPSEFCMSSGNSTPGSRASCSGTETPVLNFGTQACVPMLMPVWFPMGDIGQIPSGMVQQARAVFEQHAVIPSFFVQQ